MIGWIGGALVVLAAGGAMWHVVGERHDRRALALIESPSAADRKEAAWIAAREGAPRALRRIMLRLTTNTEPDASVREAFIYAIGHRGRPECFEIATDAIMTEAGGYVRQAAWLAAARIDPERFRQWAPSQVVAGGDGQRAAAGPDGVGAGDPGDMRELGPWDEIGWAQAWLQIGDMRGVTTLLHWAEAGDSEQRRVASQALFSGVAPLLDVAGCWPVEYDVLRGETWPLGLVSEVRDRVGRIDLQSIANETRMHAKHSALVRRNVGRLNRMRDHIARFIGGF